VYKRVLEHAVNGDEEDDHEGRALDRVSRARLAAVADRVAQRLPERVHQEREDDRRQRHPHLDHEIEDEVVGVVEELVRPAGERRQRPGEIEVAEADAEPRMRGDEGERVRPDVIAIGGKVEPLSESGLSADILMTVRPPCGEQPPHGRVQEG
jgi:hypothetical protein